jgi:hypothetical protein
MADSTGQSPSSDQRQGQSGPVRPAAQDRDRDLRRLQGLQMLMERAAGGSIPDIAAKYRVSEESVEEIMSDAWKEGVLDGLLQKLYTELSPLAMATYESQLKMGSLDAARDILGTIGLIQRPGQKNSPKVQVQPSFASEQTSVNPVPISDIEGYRLSRQTRAYKPPARRITPGEDL